MSKIASTLFLLSVIFTLSCAAKRVELPVYEGVDVKDVLALRNRISSIETTFSITFEKADTQIRGDGALNISNSGDLSMRVYSFGFPVFEIISQDGIIKSNPAIDSNKAIMLTQGLRDCLFWWDIQDFEMEETEDQYILRNSVRTVWLDRKTIFPVQQTISLQDGRELHISYGDPENTEGLWYPSKIRIELTRYAVTLKIRDILFVPGT
jgi:hypothetical protein